MRILLLHWLFATMMLTGSANCGAQTVLFEENFDDGLSDRWKLEALEEEGFRLRDGALELRVPTQSDSPAMMKIDLPFSSSEMVIASVDVTVLDKRFARGEFAGLCLTDAQGVAFTVRKTNLDGYFVLAPGQAEFIGEPGQEGDPGKYTVKYWPADESYGPLRIIVRGGYAYFQVGPSHDGKYKSIFHSAIGKSENGMGFGLVVGGGSGEDERWVRFDNFRVTKP